MRAYNRKYLPYVPLWTPAIRLIKQEQGIIAAIKGKFHERKTQPDVFDLLQKMLVEGLSC